MADSKAVPALVRNLGYDNADTRAASAFCLSELAKLGHADPAAVVPLEKMAAGAGGQTEQRAASKALTELSRRLGRVSPS